MDFKTTLLMSGFVTRDVKRLIVERPESFYFQPGQGIEMLIDEPEWRDEEGRPFTPTSLTGDRVVEFTIKGYSDHQGVTDKLHTLQPGARLLISKPFGTISYQGPGVFIAGGAGITPFLAIFRQLARESKLAGNTLLFTNKTTADIICEKELRHYFGARCLLTCTREKAAGYENRRIDRQFLTEKISDFTQHFYVCGPDPLVEEITETLKELGADPDKVVLEE